MKKYLFLSIAFSVLFNLQSDAQHATSVGGYAQHATLKGPAAKNHKPWKSPESGTTILVTQRNELKGPAAKNDKAWKEDMKMIPVVFDSLEELKGPKAKNFSPERDIDQVAFRRQKKRFSSNLALFNSL